MWAGLRDGSVPADADDGRLHDIADETDVVAPARFEAFAAGRNLTAATARYRMVRLHALTARAGAERFRPGRSPRDEPSGPDTGSISPRPGTLTALDPAPAARDLVVAESVRRRTRSSR